MHYFMFKQQWVNEAQGLRLSHTAFYYKAMNNGENQSLFFTWGNFRTIFNVFGRLIKCPTIRLLET